MQREIVKIDEELCDGCGLCVPNCHEGALQIIDGKARLISDLMCDGLGACLGHCPQDAITIEKREAEPYDEGKVMAIMVDKGENTVLAHLEHLKDHKEWGFLDEAMNYLETNKEKIVFAEDVISKFKNVENMKPQHHHMGGCPGSQAMSFGSPEQIQPQGLTVDAPSQLRQWPVQLHLVNPMAPYFQGADVLIAADCTAFSLGNFHNKYLKNKSLVIACPKLDSNMDIYVEKIKTMAEQANVNTFQVMIMEVPCCGGLLQMVKMALDSASRKVPVKLTVVGIQGEIIKEDWV